jgi:hypothetical protein
LLFVHLLPSRPSNLRVRTWRRMQQIGAIAVKQSVYVLPDTPASREDFEWLKTEIEGSGGEASVFVADAVDAWSHDSLVEEFRRSREKAYGELATDAEQLRRRLGKSKPPTDAVRRGVRQLNDRLAEIERIDFFGSGARDKAAAALDELASRSSPAPAITAATVTRSAYRRRLWVTRPRPGVDRMASAWLIRRFIDAAARFDFTPDKKHAPATAVPFDMYGVAFTHRGNRCTFEVLCEVFGLQEPALQSIAAIVHDLDLKDNAFGAPQAASVGQIIDGLQLAHADDHRLLSEGVSLFEALYRKLSQPVRVSAPRAPRRRPSRRR